MWTRELTRGAAHVNLFDMRTHRDPSAAGSVAPLRAVVLPGRPAAAPALPGPRPTVFPVVPGRAVAALGLCALLSACDAPATPAPDARPTSSVTARASAAPSVAAAASSPATTATAAAPSSAPPAASASAAPGGAAAFVADPSITATSTTLETSAGPVVVHAVHHGTLYFELGGKVLWLDPWGEALAKLPEGGAKAPRADFVLLTDIHQDHLDEKALAQVKKEGAVVMGPKAVAEKLPGTTVIANGEKKTLGTTDKGPIEVEATPMYNLKRGPEAGKLFHDKGRGNGYLLTYGGKRVYVSGDTECTPEMKALKGVDLALVVMNLPYTMTPEEAAECIAAFAPKVVVPYHHRGSDLGVLDAKLAGSGVKVEKLKLY